MLECHWKSKTDPGIRKEDTTISSTYNSLCYKTQGNMPAALVQTAREHPIIHQIFDELMSV